MIQLTRLNGTILLVNEEFIEIAEDTPDTVITMQNGHRYVVKEKTAEIMERVTQTKTEYAEKLFARLIAEKNN